MKPIIRKVVELVKKNEGEIAWNDIPQKTREDFYQEIKKSFEKLWKTSQQ